MELIVDANVFFSVLIKDGVTRELILNDKLKLFTPEYIFEELLEHLQELEIKTHANRNQIKDIIQKLLDESGICIMPLNSIKLYRKKAKEISPDPKDVPYFAAALKINCGIWSNDKELKKQKHIKIYSTVDLLKIL
jgi:predicted nucleic acid-binding protein